MSWDLMRIRKKIGVLGLLVLALACARGAEAALLTPEGSERLSLIIGDNESPYFRLGVDSTTYLKVTGPGTLTLVVRFSFPGSVGADPSWEIKVSEGGKQVAELDTAIAASASAWKESAARPGESVKLSVNVPEGEHRYQIGLTSTVKAFAGVRYLFSSVVGHQAKSAVYPVDMLEATSVSVKEKLIDFFIADSARPVKVRVIGPTRLRIVTRLAYSGVMKGPQKYSVLVDLDGVSAVHPALQTSKSPSSYFTNHKDWSVGESQTIYVDVPQGTHEVSVRLGSSSAPALAMRFTIPQEDVSR